MPELTEVTVPTVADIARLYTMQEELAALKSAEAMLRRRIFDHFFPNPTEGSKDNKYPLNDGTGAVLQADHKVNRKVLEPELDALKAAVREEGSNLPKLPFNKLVKYTPELVKAEYNKLTEEERQVFDRVLDIKPGMPEVKVVIPKRV
jgi:hypothetical protein